MSQKIECKWVDYAFWKMNNGEFNEIVVEPLDFNYKKKIAINRKR